MNQAKQFLSKLASLLRRAAGTVRAQPLCVLAVLFGLAAAVIAPMLPQRFSLILNDLNLAAAKRLAGTGTAKLAPVLAQARSCILLSVLAMALFLAAVWCARIGARSLRIALRSAVHARRLQHESAGHRPPENWETDVASDIDRISAMMAATPEWLMLAAGLVFCAALLTRTPLGTAIWIPLTAAAVCVVRDVLRARRAQGAVRVCICAAIWAAGALIMVLRAVLDAERAVPVASLCLLLLGMALIVPAALQVPYRNLPPAFAALRRVRGFLK